MTLKLGDTIKCHDKDDCINTMQDLSKAGIETDFDYSDGLRLVVTKINESRGK